MARLEEVFILSDADGSKRPRNHPMVLFLRTYLHRAPLRMTAVIANVGIRAVVVAGMEMCAAPAVACSRVLPDDDAYRPSLALHAGSLAFCGTSENMGDAGELRRSLCSCSYSRSRSRVIRESYPRTGGPRCIDYCCCDGGEPWNEGWFEGFGT